MNLPDLEAYLGRLLGRPVAADERLKLTSGQRARVAGWLLERGITPDPQVLSSAFHPPQLLAATTAPPGMTAVAVAPPSPSLEALAARGMPGMRIGIDIQDVDELCDTEMAVDPKSSPELRGIFTLREMSYAQSRPDARETLAGLFAAKEALRKCDAALLAQSLTAIEILPDVAGRPNFVGYSLSISHSGGFAIAVAAAMQNSFAEAPAPAARSAAAAASELRMVEPPRRSKAMMLAAAAVVGLLIFGGLTLIRVLTATR